MSDDPHADPDMLRRENAEEPVGCVWCKGRTLPEHDCRNFSHLEPENVECQTWCTCSPYYPKHEPHHICTCTPESVETSTVTERQGDAES